MTTPASGTGRFRLEIRRADEEYETHGFFESIAEAKEAAEGDIVGTGDRMVGTWTGPDSTEHWVATTSGATYRITHEPGQVTTSPEYLSVYAHIPHHVIQDD